MWTFTWKKKITFPTFPGNHNDSSLEFFFFFRRCLRSTPVVLGGATGTLLVTPTLCCYSGYGHFETKLRIIGPRVLRIIWNLRNLPQGNCLALQNRCKVLPSHATSCITKILIWQPVGHKKREAINMVFRLGLVSFPVCLNMHSDQNWDRISTCPPTIAHSHNAFVHRFQ